MAVAALQALDEREPVYEIIGGRKVLMLAAQPATRHIIIVDNIHSIFRAYLRGKRCRSFPDGIEVHLSDDFILRPDVSIVCDRSKIRPNGIFGAPDLVVEVLSISTEKRDRGIKKDAYEKAGVREYWIVRPADRAVEVYVLKDGRYILSGVYAVAPEDAIDDDKAAAVLTLKVSLYDDLVVDVREIFEDID
ncbi:MAG: Uma2 family endonuclease [Schwartzia sp.]|nr:Uma2 family endonuclease [Schwartzia sp. (in: firmicutes)]